jgi:ATP-dependent RNA helicase DDX52/ROK1
MDALKILTRSTKHSKNADKKLIARNLPSNGATSNPQLFGEDLAHEGETSARAPKRRKLSKDEKENDGVIPPELDFFQDKATRGGQIQNGHVTEMYGKAVSGHFETLEGDETTDLENVMDADVSEMSEDRCRAILKSHKIKVTILQEQQTSSVSETRGKKSRLNHGRETIGIGKNEERKGKKPEIFPQPLMSFSELRSRYRVSKAVLSNIDAEGYQIPTEVQLGTLSLLLNNESEAALNQSCKDDCLTDLLTIAPTGSGKTLAYLIPSIHNVLLQKSRTRNSNSSLTGPYNGPTILVIAPTKELAAQIVNEGRKLSRSTGVKVSLLRRGVAILNSTEVSDESEVLSKSSEDSASDAEESDDSLQKPQRSNKRRYRHAMKTDILISTPLTLLNSLKDDAGKFQELHSVRTLVLDEADVLLDALFQDQTLPIWKACTNPSLRVSFWSATMSSTIENIVSRTIASQYRHNNTVDAKPLRLIRLVVGLKDTAIPNITHKLTYCATESGKLLATRSLLRPAASSSSDRTSSGLRPPFLVFTQTIPRALALHAELMYDVPAEAGGSARVGVLHSTLSDSARSRVLARFRSGEIWVLVTTDLLARGIDFKGLNGVVNYDVPTSAAAYVHRVGRTGRAGRDGGVAVTLWAKEDIPHVKIIANVIAGSEKLKRKMAKEGKDEVGVDEVAGDQGVQQWLLDALPMPSKSEKQNLKRRGVEVRRVDAKRSGKGKKDGVVRTTISTKTGLRKQRRRTTANRASVRERVHQSTGTGSDFEGFSD